MKLLESVIDFSIPQVVNIDMMQFAFVPGIGTTDTIFIIHHLHEKFITATNKRLYFPQPTLRKSSIVCQEMSCSGPWGAWVWMNGLCASARECITMPRATCGSMFNLVRSLVWELVCIRALSLAHCSSSWYWKGCHVSSALVCHWSFFMMMTDTQGECIPGSRHARLA